MKPRLVLSLSLIVLSLVAGYIWSDHILFFIRTLLPANDPPHRTLTYDGWMT